MPEGNRMKSFIPTMLADKSKHFYGEVLGLKMIAEDPYGMEFEDGAFLLRVIRVQELKPQVFTVLGWHVNHIEEKIKALNTKGIFCEHYDFLHQDEMGIWAAPDGTKVAWFKDPDGNILSYDE